MGLWRVNDYDVGVIDSLWSDSASVRLVLSQNKKMLFQHISPSLAFGEVLHQAEMWGPLWRIPKRMACIDHSCSSSNHGILRVSTTRPDGSEGGLPQKCGLKPRKRGFDQHQLEFATSMLQVADLGQLHTACGNHLPIHHARVTKR